MQSSAKPTIQPLPSFDELVKLAQQDQAAFEQLKREKCQELIDSSSVEMQLRLQAQQSHLDRLVGHCKNPHHVNVVLSRELRKQLVKFQSTLQGNYDSGEGIDAANQDGTNVIHITKRSVD